MNFDLETGQQIELSPESTFNIDDFVPQLHRFEKIIGNQLLCTSHTSPDCPRLTIKPTQVLERNSKGELELIDKAPR